MRMHNYHITACLVSAFSAMAMAQEGYIQAPAGLGMNESKPQPAYTIAAPYDEPIDVQELTLRLQTLEDKERQTAVQWKKLQDAKKPSAEKPKLPNVAINGVFQADAVSFNQGETSKEAYGRIDGGADFRRARLSAKGAVSDRMDYFMQMDFGFFGRPTFTDVWADFKDVGSLGTVRVGQWKQPFGLETVSSFRYTTFMERSSLFQAFTPFRHIGVGFYNHDDNLDWTWAASYFRTGQDQFGG
ncbi:MAG: porin, partial [Pirellula sp.]